MRRISGTDFRCKNGVSFNCFQKLRRTLRRLFQSRSDVPDSSQKIILTDRRNAILTIDFFARHDGQNHIIAG